MRAGSQPTAAIAQPSVSSSASADFRKVLSGSYDVRNDCTYCASRRATEGGEPSTLGLPRVKSLGTGKAAGERHLCSPAQIVIAQRLRPAQVRRGIRQRLDDADGERIPLGDFVSKSHRRIQQEVRRHYTVG